MKEKISYPEDILGQQIGEAVKSVISPFPIDPNYHTPLLKKMRVLHDVGFGYVAFIITKAALGSESAAVVVGGVTAVLTELVIQPAIWEEIIMPAYKDKKD